MLERVFICLVALGVATPTWAGDPGSPSVWPDSLDGAVSVVLRRLSPTQRSIVRETQRDQLLNSLPEWAEDVQAVLGLRSGNRKLIAAVCMRSCTPDEATQIVMAAAWEAVRKGAP
jgi:hypothetical protein